MNSNYNMVYHNNFIHNGALDYGNNTWDYGYPSGGNYWTFYSGVDSDGDGIIDTLYDIPGGDNQDRYPFVEPLMPPVKPDRPSGKIVGIAGEEYSYSTAATDSNGDQIQYGWDWDGDLRVDYWSDFYESGETCTVAHMWDENGTYLVYVIAMDVRGIQSDWSDPLVVTMPKTDTFFKGLFLVFLQQHPNLFLILRQILLKL